MVSIFLAKLLGIDNAKESISFGNKSTTLSFNQKVNLLIDIGALDKATKQKFLTFMEVRNQFMHNLEARSYVECFGYLDGKETYLLKTYKQDSRLSKEIQLSRAVSDLSNEVAKLSADLMKKIEAKITKEVTGEHLEKFRQREIAILHRSIEHAKEVFDDYIKGEMKKKTKFTAQNLKGMGTFMSKVIYNKAKKLLEEE